MNEMQLRTGRRTLQDMAIGVAYLHDTTRIGLMHPRQNLHQRRLARPVVPQHGNDLTWMNLQRHVV